MELKPEIEERLKKLEEKYQAMGQDLVSYLDGLLYADYLTYWDYIKIDTLLSLQSPKTNLPDEQVFIIYHQITELYFKLVLLEMEQIANKENLKIDFFAERLLRMNRYFENLTQSFDIMVDGMEKDQFLKYRMTLLPASGFQSAQYRFIEIGSTDFIRLVDKDIRDNFNGQSTIEEMYDNIYWKKGSIELSTGKKTLTLEQFEQKYAEQFKQMGDDYQNKNLWALYKNLSEEDQKNEAIIDGLRKFDTNVNVNWPLIHYKSAVRYLQQKSEVIAATGGTNWQEYLPPRFQKRVFYPELWTNKEMEEWGKGFVEKELLGIN
ncbi:MAG: tryptophan 2,3-dioxygenase [Bacteroidetes bacterium]|nr:tryptophan 2,3-dioxygenase [Bacteroidia bacterium]PCH69898.1 MAG: tryptophan 2,3-dioxygenase [Bacteroidota bacterium]